MSPKLGLKKMGLIAILIRYGRKLGMLGSFSGSLLSTVHTEGLIYNSYYSRSPISVPIRRYFGKSEYLPSYCLRLPWSLIG